MAFGLSNRFPSPPSYKRIFDPGAYQKASGPITPINKVPFLSNASRNTQPGNKIWTHAIYDTDKKSRISNCTAFSSKVPRFPYEAMTSEDFEKFLCQCGIQSTCECSTSEHEDEKVICQGKIFRRLFKGSPPRVMLDTEKGLQNKDTDIQPPFYNTRVNESTSYYQGCKWSQWTSKRSRLFVASGPGPADYTIEKGPTYETKCAEKVRAYKRKTSKQLRFIEMVQQRNIRDQFPGPGSYNPMVPKGTDLNFLGPKAERFIKSKYDERPGPSDYWVKRDFEPPEIPDQFCHARLPDPAPFGCKAVRLKHKREEGPSPASYNCKAICCKFMKCSKAPFGISSVRFKAPTDDDEKEHDNNADHSVVRKESQNEGEADTQICLLPTWEFRSKTIRMKPLFKKINEPSPADFPQPNVKISRSFQLQSTAPFFTSDERFRPWYNWIPVHGAGNTPGPCYYSLERPKCLPAVRRGPLSRSPRFKPIISQTPCPNEYHVGGGIETILATHNERLKNNIEKQHKFIWKPTNRDRILDKSDIEDILFKKSIELLNVNEVKSDTNLTWN